MLTNLNNINKTKITIMIMIKKYLILLFAILIVAGCSKDEQEEIDATQVAVTGYITELGISYAKATGSVDSKYLTEKDHSVYVQITSRNFYDNSPHVEITYNMITDNNFSFYFTQLEPNRTYYYRTVVRNGEKTYYGEIKSFTTNQLYNIGEIVEVTDVTSSSAKVKLHVSKNNLPTAARDISTLHFSCSCLNERNLDDFIWNDIITNCSIKNDIDTCIVFDGLKADTDYLVEAMTYFTKSNGSAYDNVYIHTLPQ